MSPHSNAVEQLKAEHWRGARAPQPISAKAVSEILKGDCDLHNLQEVYGFTTLDRPQSSYAFFLDRVGSSDAGMLEVARKSQMLLIGPAAEKFAYNGPQVRVSNVRAGVAALLNALFRDYVAAQISTIHATAIVDPTARISAGVVIGANSTVGPETLILPNVTIGPKVRIGARCVIKSNAVIGQAGFGFYQSADRFPQHLPHVGGVIIGDDVTLGALNTVASGTFHPTVVADHVKTDDHVHIAHNCVIGPATLIAACAELSGSVSVGERVWIGPNVTIRDGITIGDQAFIAIGSVVTKSVRTGCRVFGNPAKQIKQVDQTG